MADEMTKVYCCDRPNDNSALWGALMSKNNESPAELMALMNNNNFNNNPFIWLVFLYMFRGGLWGANGAEATAENYNSRQIATLSDTVNTNHNNQIALDAIKGNAVAISELAQTFNTDYNTISTALCSIKSAIEKVGGDVNYSSERVINAVNLGDSNIVAKLQQCCCENKQLVQQMGYENQIATERQTNTLSSQMASNHSADQLKDCEYHGQTISRIDQLANGIQQGFSQIGFQMQVDKGDIINANNANTQRIVDTLNSHWSLEQSQALQDAKNEISQLKQTQTILATLNKGCGCCGCNN